MEKKLIAVIKGELAKRRGRFEGENMLQMLESPLGGEEGAADFWEDMEKELRECIQGEMISIWARAGRWILSLFKTERPIVADRKAGE